CADPVGRTCRDNRDCNDGVCHPAEASKPAPCNCIVEDGNEQGLGECGDGTPCFAGSGELDRALTAFGNPAPFKNRSANISVGSVSCAPGDDANRILPNGSFSVPEDEGAIALGSELGLSGPLMVEIDFQITTIGGTP